MFLLFGELCQEKSISTNQYPI